jgi:hypothetical protein
VGRRLCKFNGVGVMRKALGMGGGANQSAGRIGLVVVCVRKFETRLETVGWFGGKKGAPRRQVVRVTK